MPELPVVGDALSKKVGPVPVPVIVVGGALAVWFLLSRGSGGLAGDRVLQTSAGTGTGLGTDAGSGASSGGAGTGGLGDDPSIPIDIVGPTLPIYHAPVTAEPAPTLSPAIPANQRIDTSNPKPGSISRILEPTGIVVDYVTGARAEELNVGSGSVIQYINGVPISLSDWGVAHGGIPAKDIPPTTVLSSAAYPNGGNTATVMH